MPRMHPLCKRTCTLSCVVPPGVKARDQYNMCNTARRTRCITSVGQIPEQLSHVEVDSQVAILRCMG